MAASREPSAAPSSGGDTIDDQVENVKPSIADLDQADPGTPEIDSTLLTPDSKPNRRGKGSAGAQRKGKGRKSGPGAHIWINEGPAEATEDEGSVASFSRTKKSEESPEASSKTVGTAVGTRRQANGTVGSVYSGSKVKHIKKEDGTPLWRKEIQYEFLRLVIEDTTPVFTRFSDGQKGFNFADIYIDCLAKSSKTSKILKERLQVERQAAQNMAMICLLVNVGRMNTTLNFFPEMRAQLRTYHSIPVLQAYKSQRDYKSLQDAPRLKSILKGASEDEDHPRAIPAIKAKSIPRTNAVNLIFVISQFAPKISEQHFTDKVDFFDLAMRSTISSKSRARAFLWLMWWYLESDFSKEDALRNPFSPGEYLPGQDPNDPKEVPIIVPRLDHITEEEGDLENVDTEEEKEFAERMTAERKRLLAENANEPLLTMADPNNPDHHKVVKRLKKAGGYGDDDSMMLSDVDSRASPGVGPGRSPAPIAPDPSHASLSVQALGTALGAQADSLDDDFEIHDPHPGRGRYKRVRGMNTPSRSKGGRKSGAGEGGRSLLKGGRSTDTPDRYTPQPIQPGAGHAVISQFGPHKSKHELEALQNGKGGDGSNHKPRARTHYQRELEEHKQRRIEWALRRRRKTLLKEAQDLRERSRWLLRAARRVTELEAAYDTEDSGDDVTNTLGGILGRRWQQPPGEADERVIPLGREEDDFGEEAEMWLKVMKRTKKRLKVWSGERELNVYQARTARGNGLGVGADVSHSLDLLNAEDGTGMSAATVAKQKQKMDEEIAEDLLAERSDADEDEEMVDDAEVEGEGDDVREEEIVADEGTDVDVDMD